MEGESIEDLISNESFEDFELSDSSFNLPETSEDDRDVLSERAYNSRLDFLLSSARDVCKSHGRGMKIIYGLSFALMFPINYTLSFLVTKYSKKRGVVLEL